MQGTDVRETYVMREAPRVKKKSATSIMTPENAEARRLHGARRAVKNPNTSKIRAIK
jgi:hypothetical protein